MKNPDTTYLRNKVFKTFVGLVPAKIAEFQLGGTRSEGCKHFSTMFMQDMWRKAVAKGRVIQKAAEDLQDKFDADPASLGAENLDLLAELDGLQRHVSMQAVIDLDPERMMDLKITAVKRKDFRGVV